MKKIIHYQLALDLDDYSPRKNADKQKVTEEWRDVFIQFISIVELAFVETTERHRQIPPMERIRKNIFAELLNGSVCGKMYTAFPDKCYILSWGRVACIIKGTVAYFKMLDSDLKPKHNATYNSQELEENLQQKGQNQESVIWMGWNLTDDNTSISGIYVSHFKHGVLQWDLDLYDWIAKNNLTKMTQTAIEGVEPQLNEEKQKLNKNKKKPIDKNKK